MKNLNDFRSFIYSLNEAEESVSSPMDWDPAKAEAAIKKAMTQTGGSTKDKEPTGLSFKNIKDVFGNTNYSTRYIIAQALKIAGKDIFPTNTYNANLDENKKRESENKDKPYYFNTYYIGEKKQNETLDKISQAVLVAVQPLVSEIIKSSDQGKYFTSSAPSFPEVAKARVELAKVK